jgi:phospholipid/cholesterol/gamma-HCH transport system substrate-binding protein
MPSQNPSRGDEPRDDEPPGDDPPGDDQRRDDRSDDEPSPPDESSHNALWIGVAALVAVAVFFFGVRYLQGLPLTDSTYRLTLLVDDARGLLEGAPVQINGVRVGQVGTVALSEERPDVRVELQIEEGTVVPRGSQAAISGLEALQNVHVAIDRGPPGNEPLEPGARIPSAGPGTLEQLQEEALPLAVRLDTLAYRAARVMGAAEQDLPPAFENLRGASAEAEALLAGQQRRLGAVLGNLERLSADLERISTRLDTLTAGVEGDSLRVAVARANRLLLQLNATAAAAERSTGHIESILLQIEGGEGTLGRLVTDPSLYNRLDTLTLRMNRVLAAFEEDPARFLNELTLVEVF